MLKQTKEEIFDGENLLAIILRDGNFTNGLEFFNKDEDFVQVGTWNYEKGKKLKAHNHQVFERIATRTQEVVIIKSGKLKANIYNEKDDVFKEIVLNSGDILIQLGGGHDFEILEDNTQVLEVKNGPYLGVEKDKRLI